MSTNDQRSTVKLWQSHPALYRLIVACAVMSTCLGLNFLLTNQPFNGYGVDKNLVGVVFLILGALKLVFVYVHRNLIAVRVAMGIEAGWMLFWGIGTSITFFQGKTSLQLFILYLFIATVEFFLLIEPYKNPETAKGADHV